MQITVQELNEQLAWFIAANPKKHRIRLSFAKRTIESALKETVPSRTIYEFLKDNRYKFIDVDIELEQVKKTRNNESELRTNSNSENELDDIDDILNLTLIPNSPPSEEASNSSYRMNQHLLEEYDKTKDDLLFEHLVMANIKLVQSVVLKYKNYMNHNLSEEDLIQEGMFGLFEAIQRFDITLGGQLSTYAVHWIRQRVIRSIINTGTTVRIPVHMIELIRKIKKLEGKKLADSGHENINISEICRELGISEEKYHAVKLIEHRYLAFVSLNQTVGLDDLDTELSEFIPNDRLEVFSSLSEEYDDPQLTVEKRHVRENLNRLLERLTPRQKEVLELRFGIHDGKPKTLEEVGQVFGLTRERIRQIEAKAINRLRAVKNKQRYIWIS